MSDYVGAILAAGRGIRMGALGEHYPKPLLPVANEPLIVHHLRTLRGLGIKEIYIVVGHGSTQIVRALGGGSRYGVHITYIDQLTPFGIAHAVGRLASHLEVPFVLMLGDYYASAPELTRMLERAKLTKGSVIAAKVETNRQTLCEACTLEVNKEGRVLRIVEKPKVPPSDLKGCGIYVFQPEIFEAIRRTPRTALRDEYELTISIELYIQAGHPLYAEKVIEWDMNFTIPEDVLQCNLIWLERQCQRELVGTNVQLATGTQLEYTIIGDDVIVAEPSVLRQVVVFQGVQMKGGELIEQTLVTPAGSFHCIREYTRR